MSAGGAPGQRPPDSLMEPLTPTRTTNHAAHALADPALAGRWGGCVRGVVAVVSDECPEHPAELAREAQQCLRVQFAFGITVAD